LQLLGRFNQGVTGVPIVAQDVICRLVERIMTCRNELEAYWTTIVQTTPRKGTSKQTLLSVDEWSLGLTTVLKISVPWERLAKYFPGFTTAFVDENKVDYQVFLEANDPLHCVLKKFPSDVPRFDVKVQETLSRLMDIIHKNRKDLKDTFRWLDSDGSGQITFEEFRTGLVSLHLISELDSETSDVVRQLFNRIDINGDGSIVYEEFFDAFQTTNTVEKLMNEELGAE
jgi:Ca2+-binding EF-hand superfamily protein